MKRVIVLAVLCAVMIASAASAAQYTYIDLIHKLTDLEALAVLPTQGETCKQWSSYDRVSPYDVATGKSVDWEANDGDGIIREENGMSVLAEMDGPGCIWRIWSAAPGDGRVKIYLDGESEPAVDLPFKDYFNRTSAPFVYPSLVYDASKGKNCYVPIPYRKSCKIVAEKNWGRYYHFNYATYPKDTLLPTFKRELSPRERIALASADRLLTKNLGNDPVGKRAGEETLSATVGVAPGKRVTVARLAGPRAITAIRVKLDPSKVTPESLREVALRIFWDGDSRPSVWAPLGDFFGTAPGLNSYKSLPMGESGNILYSYWYMPFAGSATVELVNDGKSAFSAQFEVVHAPLARPIAELGRFHAKWHRDAFLPKEPVRWIDWTMLTTQGRGRFCGVALEIWNPKEGWWWGEGDEKFFVDGEKFPSTIGTGLEDYFGYAWCDPTLFQNAYHNQTRNDGDNVGHISVNRWHITDNVPFQTSFEGCIEKYCPNDRPTLYACTAYWYQAPGGFDPYEPVPMSERLFYVKP